jgi:transposase
MHVVKVISRRGDQEYVSYLLRQSYREGNQVKKRTLANLSALPEHIIDAIRRGLAGDPLLPASGSFSIEQSWPHGHVAAVLGTARAMGLERLLEPRPSRQRTLALALIVARVLHPASKLATTRLLSTTSLARTLGVEDATENDLYAAMDWLLARQERIEQRLAKQHLEPGGVVLYDLSSTYLEGERCPLAKRGHSRDGKPGHKQIEFGLVTNAEGEPVAIEVFAGNTADPATFQRQVQKAKDRFGVADVVWVGDRGMITGAQVRQLQAIAGLSWITALRAPSIQQLLDTGTIQLSLFDTQNLAEVADPRYPGERLVVCHNPLLAAERKRKREELLVATEKELAKVAAMAERGAAGGRAGLQAAATIGERVGRVVNKYNMAKHFRRNVTDTSFSFERDAAAIAREAALDGLYVLRTNVAPARLDSAAVVLAYKSLEQVEDAFHHFKLTDLEVRPVYHYLENRVRAHLLLCMLAYSVQRTMERALAPLLFKDEAIPERDDPVAPAPRSEEARRKEQTKLTAERWPVHSFRTLLAQLGTLVQNRVVPHGASAQATFDMTTQPSPLQARAFDLLGISLKPL